MFYMSDKLPSRPDLAEWIDCSWTVYVNEPASELPLELGVRSDLPQFTVRGLDPSFVGQAYTILLGKTEFDVAREYQDNAVATEDRARRVAEGVVIPNELTVQVSVYSDKVCRLLAAMDEQRIVDMAGRWPVLLFPSMQQPGSDPGPSSRQQLRESVLRQPSPFGTGRGGQRQKADVSGRVPPLHKGSCNRPGAQNRRNAALICSPAAPNPQRFVAACTRPRDRTSLTIIAVSNDTGS